MCNRIGYFVDDDPLQLQVRGAALQRRLPGRHQATDRSENATLSAPDAAIFSGVTYNSRKSWFRMRSCSEGVKRGR